MTMFKRIASLLLISLVAACGGSGDGGTSVFGGPGGTTPPALTSDLLLTVSSASLPNTGSASVTVTATALDASRNTLPDVAVSMVADSGAVLAGVSGAKTDANGAVTASLNAGGNQSNRLITVTATSGAITKTATVQVSGTKITATLVPATLAPGAKGEVQYQVVDSSGKAMVNQTVQVVATNLAPADAAGTTDSNGKYTFAYTAPAAVGSYTVLASIAGVTDSRNISVQPTSTVPNVVGAIVGASVSATPSVLAVNVAGSTNNQSVIRAVFTGTGNLPLPNVRARFDLGGDVNSVGGTFSAGGGAATDKLYSDANGVVTTSYISGARSGPTNGVTVRLCYGTSDSDPGLLNCTNAQTVSLTVVAEPLGVTIGTNALIIPTTLTYIKQYVVTVVDSAGNPKADVTLAASVDLPQYRKGLYDVGTKSWFKVIDVGCKNEDTNRNGVLEAGEDSNGDGQLWPRKPDVTVVLLDASGKQVTSTTTAANGTAILQIEYAQDHASWVDALITVAASGVAGSEGRANYLVSPVPVLADAVNNVAVPPAFQVSPYGFATACTSPN
jgi:hypothetical protein